MIEVTSLADHGPGTLREALNDPAPRTIIFRVGGTIELDSPFSLSRGQTAPGDGICLKNTGLTIATDDALSLLGTHGKIADGNADADQDGYANLEEYLHSLTGAE